MLCYAVLYYISKIALVIIKNGARWLVENFVLSRYNHRWVIIAMTAFSFQNAARFVGVSESQIEQFCFIFSNNHQCNFTKTMGLTLFNLLSKRL